eukprot:1211639-Pleurochrysis_carterae.AAC.1
MRSLALACARARCLALVPVATMAGGIFVTQSGAAGIKMHQTVWSPGAAACTCAPDAQHDNHACETSGDTQALTACGARLELMRSGQKDRAHR